jgi:molybdate transport system permease protein
VTPQRAARVVQLAAIVAALFFAFPLIGIVARVPWSSLGDALDARVLSALSLSLAVALGSLAATVTLGLPLAWWLAAASARAQAGASTANAANAANATNTANAANATIATIATIVRAFVALPMVLPPVVAGVGLLFALGRRGVFGGVLASVGIELPFTSAAAVIAATFVSAPFFVLTAESGFAAVNQELVVVARSLGASPWLRFRTAVWPALAPAVRTGAALTFARALGEFGATITFAGNLEGRTQTLPLLVYQDLYGEPARAALLSLLLLAVAAVALALLRPRVRP